MTVALRYPLETGGDTDYVMFTPTRYRSNAKTSGSSAAPFLNRDGTSAASPPANLRNQPSIVLYMPNSSPSISNGQGWAGASFLGPLGIEQRDAARSLGDLAEGVATANTGSAAMARVDEVATTAIKDITRK